MSRALLFIRAHQLKLAKPTQGRPHPHFAHPEPHVVLDEDILPPLTTQETAKLASVFCFFW